jgi:hypothetical protein
MLTSIKAPKQLLGELDKVHRRFLWTNDGEITWGKCKVGWPLVARPIVWGDWGFLTLGDLVGHFDYNGYGLHGATTRGHG